MPLPLLVLAAGTWTGYVSCERDLTFELLVLTPWLWRIALVLAAVSTAIVAWRTPKGWRAPVAGLHVLILALASVLLRETQPLGRWFWEQQVLRNRYASLKQYVPKASDSIHTQVTIDGHVFAGFEQTPQGALFYTEVMGGPWCSSGIFVPQADTPPGLPANVRSATPTSVPGLFWFVTKD